MTKNIPGSRTNPEGIPQEGHGGSNVRGTQAQQGKDGNGAQKRQQEKKQGQPRQPERDPYFRSSGA
jgi:hypothetical protein